MRFLCFLLLCSCVVDVEPDVESDLATELEIDLAMKVDVDEPRPKTLPPCDAPKVRICHLPGGDLSKAQTLCIASSAVKQHQLHHGDLMEACTTEPTMPPEPEPEPACRPYFDRCVQATDCCQGAACTDGECTPQI